MVYKKGFWEKDRKRKVRDEEVYMEIIKYSVLTSLYYLVYLLLIITAITLVKRTVLEIIKYIFGYKGAYWIETKFTFIGVILHEMAHALMAVITGAKVVKVNLFNITPRGRELGSVDVACCGPSWLKSIQKVLIGMAPIISGFALLYLLNDIEVDGALKIIGLIYLKFSIAFHMDMSAEDRSVFMSGVPLLFIMSMICIGLYRMIR